MRYLKDFFFGLVLGILALTYFEILYFFLGLFSFMFQLPVPIGWSYFPVLLPWTMIIGAVAAILFTVFSIRRKDHHWVMFFGLIVGFCPFGMILAALSNPWLNFPG